MTSRLNFYKPLSPSKENSENIRSNNRSIPQNSTHIKLSNSLSSSHISLSQANGNKQADKIQFDKGKYHQNELGENVNKNCLNKTHIDLSKQHQRPVLSHIDLSQKQNKVNIPSQFNRTI